jgi:hypothetical protein
MRAALEYWWNVVRISFPEACELVGWGRHPVRWLISALVWSCTTAFFWFVFHDVEEVRNSVLWLVSGLAAAVLLFAGIFLWQILAVPPRLATDAELASCNQIESLKGELAALQQRLANKDACKAQRQRISDFIASANLIVRKLVKCNEDGPLLDEAFGELQTWLADVQAFIRAEEPDFLPWFESDAGGSSTVLAGPARRARYFAFMHNRIQRLQELTNRVSASAGPY